MDEIESAGIDHAFEKFYLVVQAYNNNNKDLVQTLLSTIQ